LIQKHNTQIIYATDQAIFKYEWYKQQPYRTKSTYKLFRVVFYFLNSVWLLLCHVDCEDRECSLFYSFSRVKIWVLGVTLLHVFLQSAMEKSLNIVLLKWCSVFCQNGVEKVFIKLSLFFLLRRKFGETTVGISPWLNYNTVLIIVYGFVININTLSHYRQKATKSHTDHSLQI
jgi:hypothetical protein